MMVERKEYTMDQSDLDALIEACRPVPLIALGSGPITAQQQNANEAWRKLGEKMGFDGMTARPVPGKSELHFTAEPTDG